MPKFNKDIDRVNLLQQGFKIGALGKACTTIVSFKCVHNCGDQSGKAKENITRISLYQ